MNGLRIDVRLRSIGAVLVVVGCFLSPLPTWSAQADGEDPFLARAYNIRHRALADAADLVSPLLSDEGTVTLRPRLRTLVVEDRRSVLDRVQALLESFDLPPRDVELTFSLFLGTAPSAGEAGAARAQGGFSTEIRGVLESLGDFTKWTDYELLGSRSINGIEGRSVEASLSVDYRVRFTVESVDDANSVVAFRMVLQRLGQDDAGLQQVNNLLTTDATLAFGQLHVVGAASGPNADRALFLTMQTRGR